MKATVEITIDTHTNYSSIHNADVTDVIVWTNDRHSPTGREVIGTQTVWGGAAHDDIINNMRADIVSAISRNMNVNPPIERKGERNG